MQIPPEGCPRRRQHGPPAALSAPRMPLCPATNISYFSFTFPTFCFDAIGGSLRSSDPQSGRLDEPRKTASQHSWQTARNGPLAKRSRRDGGVALVATHSMWGFYFSFPFPFSSPVARPSPAKQAALPLLRRRKTVERWLSRPPVRRPHHGRHAAQDPRSRSPRRRDHTPGRQPSGGRHRGFRRRQELRQRRGRAATDHLGSSGSRESSRHLNCGCETVSARKSPGSGTDL